MEHPEYFKNADLGHQYLLFLYFKKVNVWPNRYALVFSMNQGVEALAFFNASATSPRGKSKNRNRFYPPRHGAFFKWWEEIARFKLPRSPGEFCIGFEKQMKAQFFVGNVIEKIDDEGNVLNVIDLKTLIPQVILDAKNGWRGFDPGKEKNGNHLDLALEEERNSTESYSGEMEKIPF